MPKGDGTGPKGEGPMTGRGLGNCKPGTKPCGLGLGQGRGLGLGQGKGFGGGNRTVKIKIKSK